ncbi:MAG TPA: ATP synthase subunit C [Ramlibacter sp.]
MKPESRSVLLVTAAAALAALAAVGLTGLLFPAALAAPTPAAPLAPDTFSWGFVGAALATGLSTLGAGIAVGKLGAAAVGALAEKPELFGRLLMLVGLAEGIAIYGLIVSILILNRLG